MARKRRRKQRPRHPDLDPFEVLEGRVRPEVGELLQLIHRVNPTSLELPAQQRNDRYDLKSQLQSLLIIRHADQLVIETDPEQPHIVSIRHRYSPADACHAVIDDLEPESRSLVRRTLDEQLVTSAAPEEAHPTPVAARTPQMEEPQQQSDDPLAAGEAALEQFDFDEARRCFAEATRRSPASVLAARRLLELLLDHLGEPAKALEMATTLAPETATHAEIAALTSLAAARVDDLDRAERLVRNAAGPRVAEAHLAVARAAIRSEDADRADLALEEARRHGLELSLAAPVEEAISRLRSGHLAGLEAELERVHQGGDTDAAEAMAHSILRRWPSSSLARSVVRAIEKERIRQKVGDTLERAHRAEDQGAHAAAAGLLREAVELDPGLHAELGARIERLELIHRHRQETRRAAKVAALLSQPSPEQGLLAFLELGPELRAAVSDAVPLPLLVWLEQTAATPGSQRARAAVAAVLALDRARHALETGQPGEALSILEPHAKALRQVAEAERVGTAATKAVEQERLAAARRSLAAAEQAMDEGRLDAARAHLERLPTQQLTAAEQHRARELDEHLRGLEKTGWLEARSARLEAAGDLLAARDVAARLAQEAAAEQQRDAWSARAAQLDDELRRSWKMEVIDTPDMRPEPRESVILTGDDAPVWVTSDGMLVFVLAHSRWIFIWVIDPDCGELKQAVSLRVPYQLDLITWSVDRSGISIAGSEARLLRLTYPDWRVAAWCDLSDMASEDGMRIVSTIAVPSSRHVWCLTSRASRSDEIRVWDLDNRCVVRTYNDVISMASLPGTARSMVAVTHYSRSPILFDANGKVGRTIGLDSASEMTCIAPHPDDEMLVVGMDAPDKESLRAQDEVPLQLITLSRADEILGHLVIPESDFELPNAVATSLEDRRTFLVFHSIRGGKQLASFKPARDGLQQEYLANLGTRGLTLATDEHSRRVVLVAQTAKALQTRLLGSEPPADLHESALESLPRIDPMLGHCGRDEPDAMAERSALKGLLYDLDGPHRNGRLDRIKQSRENDPKELASLICAAAEVSPDLATELLEWARGLHPDSAALRLLEAEQEFPTYLWKQVRDPLTGVDVDDLSDRRARHLYHLLCIACLQLGDLDAAREAAEKGGQFDGSCDLAGLTVLLAELRRDSTGEDTKDQDSTTPTLAARTIRALRRADESLARGDARAVIAVLDQSWVWHANVMQAHAFLAAAYMELVPETAEQRFQQRLCLATINETMFNSLSLPISVPVAGLSLDRDRMATIFEQTRAWLESE